MSDSAKITAIICNYTEGINDNSDKYAEIFNAFEIIDHLSQEILELKERIKSLEAKNE